MTGSESGHEDIDRSVVGLILLEVSVDDFERVIVGESDLAYVVEGVGDQGKELMRCVDGFSGFSPNLPQKLFSMSLAVALRPGFLTIRLGSRSIPSFCLYCQTY